MHAILFPDRLYPKQEAYRLAHMSTGCIHVCSSLHNLQQGGMIMLHELFQKHEAFTCHMLTHEKSSQCIFDHFMPLVA